MHIFYHLSVIIYFAARPIVNQLFVFQRYQSENIYQSFTHKMAAKASWH